MTDAEIIETLQRLTDLLIKKPPVLRVNSLLTPNKTEMEYYKYREKSEWLKRCKWDLKIKKNKRENRQ